MIKSLRLVSANKDEKFEKIITGSMKLVVKDNKITVKYRQDIIYTKEIAYISTIFLLNSENYFQALVNMVNFVLDSPGIKFIQKNEEFIKIRI